MQSNRILILGYIWPEPQSSAAGLRTWNLVETFSRAGWEVIFASAAASVAGFANGSADGSTHGSTDGSNGPRGKLEGYGVQTAAIQLNDSRFDSWVRDLQPDFVIFDRFLVEEQLGWRVQEACPSAVRIIDTQDLHFLRRSRAIALKEGKTVEELSRCDFEFHSEDVLRELSAIYRSDLTYLLSPREIELLTSQFQIPKDLLALSRFHYPDPPVPRPFDQRKNFAMIGNFRHPPNRDGIIWLHQRIWPRIRKLFPEAEVHIYGAYPPREMVALHDPKIGFFIEGPIEDPREMFQSYRVNLAPLRFGAGIKGKITDGWWAGIPVIATSIAAEGMSDSCLWGGEIADDEEEFAKLAVQLYQDSGRWNQRQKEGFNLMRQLYSTEQNQVQMIEQILSVRNRLQERRQRNWVGAILNHQLHKSTKYFSKWIEEKNSNSSQALNR